MKKRTKIIAVFSTAALLSMGAAITSFAVGWEKDSEGIWHYYDSNGDMVTDGWAKDGSKWYYLDENGNMLVDSWVDDDYYVGSDGAMLHNQWVKTLGNDETSDTPGDGGERWYYFGAKGKKVVDNNKKINGRTYYFDSDGKMATEGKATIGQMLWYQENGTNASDGSRYTGWM